MRTELVTSLKRRATEIIAALEERAEPILITQYGLPAAYLVDVESYHKLRDRLALLEGIARGERAISEGRVTPAARGRRGRDR
jgi:prevent-host-death family protein